MFHTSLLVVLAAEVVGLAAIMLRRPVVTRHFSSVADFAVYWVILVFLWLPLYLMIDVLPRLG